MTATQTILHVPLYQRGTMYGANLVASEFDDSQIVVFGPRGCSSQVLESQLAQRQECHFRSYPVSQADVLTNGISALKRTLLPHIAAYGVKGPLFLFLGDAPRVTSEDIEGFVETCLPPRFPIVYVEAGFRGGYYAGINEALYKTVKRFCTEKKATNRRLLNLIPDVGTSPHWRGSARELARVLEKLGVEVNVFPNRNEIPDLARLTDASATVLVNPEIGMRAAALLQDRFGIPVCAPKNMPIGLMGTELWLKEIAELTGILSSHVDEIIEQETVEYFLDMKPALRDDNYNTRIDVIRASKFLICDEINRALQWSRVLVNEFDMGDGYVFPTERPDEGAPAAREGVTVIDDTASLRSLCEDPEVGVVLGSDWITELLQRKLDKLVCVSNPVVKTITLVSKPYYGFRGALHFLEDVLNGVTY